MPELGASGSVRGALRNERPYREPRKRIFPRCIEGKQQSAIPRVLGFDGRSPSASEKNAPAPPRDSPPLSISSRGG